MFLKWAQKKISKWVTNPKNIKKVAPYLIPLVVHFLRHVAKPKDGSIPDRLIDELETWGRHL